MLNAVDACSQNNAAPETPVLEITMPITITTDLHRHSGRKGTLNQFVGREKAGKGRHGEVFVYQDSEKDFRPVAVKAVKRSNPKDKMKLLRKTYQDQEGTADSSRRPKLSSTENSIRKEIAVMKRCRHPHLAALFEVIDDPKADKIYLVMEYLEGGPVEWCSAENRPLLSLAQTRRIIRDVILGLEFMHSKNILHRDIKPSNILYTYDRRSVKLIDFGVSHIVFPHSKTKSRKSKPSDPDAPLFSRSDLLKRIGTPSFLAPEVVWFSDALDLSSCVSYDNTLPTSFVSRSDTVVGASFAIPKVRPPVTRAIDIWALGVTFYCFLFGHTPFSGASASGDNDNVRHHEFVLYHQICTADWSVDEFMGSERAPTGTRHPENGRRSRRRSTIGDGDQVTRLLHGLLQKDPMERMTLSQLKKNSFILQDIPDPRLWLKSTVLQSKPRSCWEAASSLFRLFTSSSAA